MTLEYDAKRVFTAVILSSLISYCLYMFGLLSSGREGERIDNKTTKKMENTYMV